MNEVHRWSKARTVKKQHGKKSTTILLVFCQQNLFGKKSTKNIIGK